MLNLHERAKSTEVQAGEVTTTGVTLYSLKPLQPLTHVSLDVIFDVMLIDSWLDLQDKIELRR